MKSKLNQLYQSLEAEHKPKISLSLHFYDTKIRVRTNSENLNTTLKGYFKRFVSGSNDFDIDIIALETEVPPLDYEFTVKQPDPGKTKIKESYADDNQWRIVKKVLTGMVFMFDGSNNLAIGPCIENANQVVNFINNRFIEHKLKKDFLLFHSAAVSLGSRGIAISGFSGMGKSTLALEMMGRGMTFVSNDRLMVNNTSDGLFMYGVAKYPRINPGTIVNNADLIHIISESERAAFEQMKPDELWQVEQKYDVFIDDIYGDEKFTISSPMEILIVLNWKRIEKPLNIDEIDISERMDLYPAFMKTPGLFFHTNDGKVPDISKERYKAVLQNCRVFELTGGVNFNRAANYFVDLVRNGG